MPVIDVLRDMLISGTMNRIILEANYMPYVECHEQKVSCLLQCSVLPTKFYNIHFLLF